jgi:hypothetical protein
MRPAAAKGHDCLRNVEVDVNLASDPLRLDIGWRDKESTWYARVAARHVEKEHREATFLAPNIACSSLTRERPATAFHGQHRAGTRFGNSGRPGTTRSMYWRPGERVHEF